MPTFINLFTLSTEPWSIGCAGMTRLAVVISLLGLLLLFSSASTPKTVLVAAKVSDAAEAGRIEDPSLCVVDVVGAAAAAAAVETSRLAVGLASDTISLRGMLLLSSTASTAEASAAEASAAESSKIGGTLLCVVDAVGTAAAAAVELTFGGVANGAGVEDGRSAMAL
jgi:hypothetical protein